MFASFIADTIALYCIPLTYDVRLPPFPSSVGWLEEPGYVKMGYEKRVCNKAMRNAVSSPLTPTLILG